MNKAELVTAMAAKVGMTKKETEQVLNAFTNVVLEEMQAGGKIQLVGFGTFEVAERAARVGRNPKTNEEIEIPASKAMKFKQGKNVKEILNA